MRTAIKLLHCMTMRTLVRQSNPHKMLHKRINGSIVPCSYKKKITNIYGGFTPLGRVWLSDDCDFKQSSTLISIRFRVKILHFFVLSVDINCYQQRVKVVI